MVTELYVLIAGTNIWLYRDGEISDNIPMALDSILGNNVTVDRVDAAILWRKYTNCRIIQFRKHQSL